MKYTIRLHDNTVGSMDSSTVPVIGNTVTVALHDENGMPINVTGIVAEILRESDY